MMVSIAEGHDIVALANLRPESKDELDSYMYQTVGHHAIDLYAEAMDLPLYVRTIKGSSLSIGRDYRPQEGDEVEDLFQLLSQIKAEKDIEAVSVGAILSDYQRVRVENVCQRLGLTVLAFLWRRNQEELLKEMIDCDLKAIIIKVAAMGLLPDKHLGMELEEIFPHMLKMKQKYGLNECGEGGEFETFVYDCPLFKKSIVLGETELVIHSNDAFAPVGYLNLKNCHLQEKVGKYDVASFLKNVPNLPLTTTEKWIARHLVDLECVENEGASVNVSPDISLGDETSECSPLFATDGLNFQVSGIRASLRTTSDISQAAKTAMDSLKECVEKVGHQMSDLTSVSLYVQSMTNFAKINAVYSKYFEINPPSRICIQVPLPSNVVFQLDAEGRKNRASEDESERRTMHVQSLSHWAPANIGPFSQAILTGSKLFVSGTTALVPSNSMMIRGGISVQSKVSLIHLVEKLVALSSSCKLAHCPMVNCYVTRKESIPVAKRAFDRVIQENKDTLGDSVSLFPSLQFCVVPRLPKGALVEWHAYAWIGLDNEEIHCTQFTKKFPLHSFTFQTALYQDRFSCSIEVCDTNRDKVDIKALARNLLEEYSSIAATQICKRGLAKIFIPADRFSHETLVNSFTQVVPGVDMNNIPVLSFVPVTCLQTERHILVWCQ